MTAMNFGFGISEFINVVHLTWRVYQRCKASAQEFRDISREVSSLHIVLKAIEAFWAKVDLSPLQRYDLSQLAEGCKEVLKDLEKSLDKYPSLGSNLRNPIDRIRWAAANVEPLRHRLISNVVLLSNFNATIAQAATIDRITQVEARILQRLNVIHQDFQEGRRAAPAFSQVTTVELNRADDSAWENISADLEEAGIDSNSISGSRPFIRNWIDNVILEDSPDDRAKSDEIQRAIPINRSTTPRTDVDGGSTPNDTVRSKVEKMQRHRSTYSGTSPFSASDIFKITFAIILPPLGVFFERGCGSDLAINVGLTILFYIPGIIHALYLILKY